MPAKPYRTDLVVMGTVIILLTLLFVGVDLPGSVPSYFESRYKYAPKEVELVTTSVDSLMVNETRYFTEGIPDGWEFPVSFENMTSIMVELTWTDDYGDNDRFLAMLQVDGEDLLARDSATGSITLEIDDPHPGNYSLQVEAVECPGFLGVNTLDRDNGNDCYVRVTVTWLETVEVEVA